MRPIISYLGSPLYSLSKFLSNILNCFVGNNFSNVKNAEDFRNKIKNVSLPPNYILISLDVISLFTNVDSVLVLNLVKQFWNDIKLKSSTNLDLNNFLEALKFVLDHTEFSFDGRYFKQVFGSPMGSPVSPSLANLLMEHIETEVLKTSSIKPIFFYRYVDDIIAAIPKSAVDSFLNNFNSFTPRIKFTCEIENDCRLAFLDLIVIREEDGSLKTDWYHKKSWSGRYLNFDSWLPISYKNNTAFLLAEKILKLSDNCFHSANFKKLTDVLEKNGYPKNIITRNIRKAIDKNNNSDNPRETQNLIIENTRQIFISIPYVKILFEKIKFLVQNYDIQIVGRAFHSLDKLLFSKLKDKIPIELQSNLVYKLKCSCGKEYVGQTKQCLKKRVYQHIHDSTFDFKLSHSAMSNHLRTCGHSLSIEDAKILDKESNLDKRLILESIFIKQHQNSFQNLLNVQEVSKFLLNYYDTILLE